MLYEVITYGFSTNAHTLDVQSGYERSLNALIPALASILVKETLYRWTAAVGKEIKSPAMAANAWHHRSDAISSVPVLIAVAGALIFLSSYNFV